LIESWDFKSRASKVHHNELCLKKHSRIQHIKERIAFI
jgi:hypothetical protein